MATWPRSAYAAFGAMLVAGSIAAYWLYTETRTAYRAVGFIDGQIHQREQTMKAITQSATVEDCKRWSDVKPPVELLAVKAESLYMSVAEDGSARFCR